MAPIAGAPRVMRDGYDENQLRTKLVDQRIRKSIIDYETPQSATFRMADVGVLGQKREAALNLDSEPSSDPRRLGLVSICGLEELFPCGRVDLDPHHL